MVIKRKIANGTELQNAITALEQEVKVEEAQIKASFAQVKEAVQPKNLLRNTFSYVAETPEVQKVLINTIVGFILGYTSKKAAQVLSEDKLDRIVDNFNRTLETAVSHQLTKFEKKKPDSWLVKGLGLIRKHTPPSSPIYPFVRYR